MSYYWDQSLPTFPSDVPIARLGKVHLQRLQSANEDESQKLFESCRTTGFFLLDLQGSPEGTELLRDVEQMFKLGRPLFGLDTDTKMKYAKRKGTTYGYVSILP